MTDPHVQQAAYDDTAIRIFFGAVGAVRVGRNIGTGEAMQKVLDSGGHRTTHLRGRKPE